MPTYDDHRAWITVNDEIIPEFDVRITEPPKHSEDPVTITCWVPSELGKRFKIFYYSPLLSSCNAWVYIDGTLCDKLAKRHPEVNPTFSFHGLKTGRDIVLPYLFSRVETTDDDDMLAACGTSGQGEIVVEGNKVRIYNETHADMFYNRPDGKRQHERAKKAIDHQVGFGSAEKMKRRRVATTVDIVERVVKFVFRYRTIEMLRANGVAPLPPRTERETQRVSEDDDEDETEEELLNLRKRLAELEQQRSQRPSKKRVKPEPAPNPKFEFSAEIIDLTL